ncbi:uncharacterized protein PHACADRAFT_265641, partial [Phanerochaete carnosa HHB-10118-sp]
MQKAGEDVHELNTLCSLRTASSETLRMDSPKEASAKQSLLPRSREECQKLSPRQRQILGQCNESQLETSASPSGATYGVLFELSRTKSYGPAIHYLALRLMFRDMKRGHVDGLARALVALSLEEIEAFFAGMSADERSQWVRFSRVSLRSTAPLPTTGLWYALIKAMAEAHDTLDSARAVALLRMYDWHTPFVLLFPSDPSKPDPSRLKLILNYVQASYSDCLPQVRDDDPNPPESDIVLQVYAAYFSICPEPLLSSLLDHVIAGFTSHTLRDFHERDLAALSNNAPYFIMQPSSLDEPADSSRGRIWMTKQHPASPYLLFALRLATWSAAARAGLVKRGVVQAIEALYDMDETVVNTDCGERLVSGISQHIMLQLCALLLGALSECYDSSRSTLMEELRADIASYSRSMSRRFFAPEVWEIRD